MKKVIIILLTVMTIETSGCGNKNNPPLHTSPVKTIKVVNHQVNPKFKYNPPKKKTPKLKTFLLPIQKSKKMIYTNSNNILENKKG